MEAKRRNLFEQVSPSVVIVSEPGASKSSNYCIGFIVVATEAATFVLTHSSIVKSGNPVIHFFDKSELEASLEVTGPCFSLLRTGSHSGCKAVNLMEADERPSLVSDVLTIAPALSYFFYSIPGSVMLDSCESTGNCIHDRITGSEREFLASCDYSEMSGNGNSRLLSGPVFSMEAQVLGIVTGDYGYVDEHGVRSGFEIKKVLLAKHVNEVLLALVQDKNWTHCIKRGDKDWKRHLSSLNFEPEVRKRKRDAKATKGV